MSNHWDIHSESRDFVRRHIGPDAQEIGVMLEKLGFNSLDALVDKTVPPGIRTKRPLKLPAPVSEFEALRRLQAMVSKNKVFRSYIGMGYSDCITPPVVQRNILENPGWYTQYTPYQAEIAQGRLEALLNFQTMVADLTALPIVNASLLDEGTAAAEAMSMALGAKKPNTANVIFVSRDCHPQTIAVVQTRAEPLAVEVVVGSLEDINESNPPFAVLLQYPTSTGSINDYAPFIAKQQAAGSMIIMACDLLALTLLKPPGEFGADIAIGSAQRFGVPLGYGGPHAAFFATKDEHKRRIPGRIIGVSKDVSGRPALRMALQTREQHIRRDKATSNICTSQVLLAVMASMYAVYHGPKGLKDIAQRIHSRTKLLAQALIKLGYKVDNQCFFDTLQVSLEGRRVEDILKRAVEHQINLRPIDPQTVGISLDEKTTIKDLEDLLRVFTTANTPSVSLENVSTVSVHGLPQALTRTSSYLEQQVFNQHHSETKMLRYIRRLEGRDLSLTRSMIPLGSCTMKLNATAELMPVTWQSVNGIHPFAPSDQCLGYKELTTELEQLLAECTGFDKISLQPNSGAQGEYAGLLVIRKFHQSRGEGHRHICLIPKSAHGTNPASAVLAGMKVVVVECDEQGNVDVADLEQKAAQHSQNLSALMITYPSTHGVFEEAITQICDIVHQHGGQVYMDGANMNAQIGLCKPGEFGPDVCHLNLHKTFCIPHGGGGPGVGPIGVKSHLAPYLPGHPLVSTGGEKAIGPVSAAPWGSASILPISLMYIWMMGAEGLTQATKTAILNANYIASRLAADYPVLYRGQHGLVAHECIIDLRRIKAATGIEVEDVAKRLMDYGFHAPTVSFPVAGTLMIEPTESEAIDELDRFCEAMSAIRQEIDSCPELLRNAPHPSYVVTASEWQQPYTREQAAFPRPWVRDNKFWPHVARIDAAYGDRNLICTCDPIESYT